MAGNIDLLYDHYKDTCSLIGSASGRRDRLMLLVVAILALSSVQTFFPTIAGDVLAHYLASQYGLHKSIDLALLGNLIWFLLLLFTIRYFQTATYVERQYAYLHILENRLNESLGGSLITREGKSYLADYPLLQDWIAFLYRVVVPGMMLVLSTIRITREWRALPPGLTSPAFLVDGMIYLTLVVSITLYLLMLHAPAKLRFTIGGRRRGQPRDTASCSANQKESGSEAQQPE